jgi:tetratricopeptide (TPR) repeat protein
MVALVLSAEWSHLLQSAPLQDQEDITSLGLQLLSRIPATETTDVLVAQIALRTQLASALRHKGGLQPAKAHLRESLKIAERLDRGGYEACAGLEWYIRQALGEVEAESGDIEEAIGCQVKALFEIAEKGNMATSNIDYARVAFALARTADLAGLTTGAQDIRHGVALRLYRHWSEDHDVDQYMELACYYTSSGEYALVSDSTSSATLCFERALELLSQKEVQTANSRSVREMTAFAQSGLGVALALRQQKEQSKELLDKARSTLLALCNEEPDSTVYATNMAALEVAAGKAALHSGDPSVAVERLQEGLRLVDEVLRKNNELVWELSLKAEALVVLGRAYERSGRALEAHRAWRKAVALRMDLAPVLPPLLIAQAEAFELLGECESRDELRREAEAQIAKWVSVVNREIGI